MWKISKTVFRIVPEIQFKGTGINPEFLNYRTFCIMEMENNSCCICKIKCLLDLFSFFFPNNLRSLDFKSFASFYIKSCNPCLYVQHNSWTPWTIGTGMFLAGCSESWLSWLTLMAKNSWARVTMSNLGNAGFPS